MNFRKNNFEGSKAYHRLPRKKDIMEAFDELDPDKPKPNDEDEDSNSKSYRDKRRNRSKSFLELKSGISKRIRQLKGNKSK